MTVSKFLEFLLFWKKTNSLTALQKKSQAVVDVFTKTQSQFNNINVQIEKVVASKEEAIKALQSEVSTLTGIKTQNAKIAGKIGIFLAE